MLGVILSTNTVECLAFALPNSLITLSKNCPRRTSDKAIVMQSCILDILLRSINIIAGKRFTLFYGLGDSGEKSQEGFLGGFGIFRKKFFFQFFTQKFYVKLFFPIVICIFTQYCSAEF